MTLGNTTILRDTIFLFKDFLSGAIADPISNRPTGQKFLHTSYPQEAVTYPIITVKDINSTDVTWLGFQSESMRHEIDMEVRVWAKDVVKRDQIAGSVYNAFRTNRLEFTGSQFHDLRMVSMVNVDADKEHSKVMTYRVMVLPGDII